jgi:ElaB/YqjD/DUF883 family membrane-anchored ribosome-binding protein
MSETTPQGPEEDQEARAPEQIEKDIEETRDELADTVAAVAEKADVKKQAKAKVAETKARAKAKVTGAKETATAKKDEFTTKAAGAAPDSTGAAGQQAQQYLQQGQTYAKENPVQAAAAGALVAGFVLGWLWGRR